MANYNNVQLMGRVYNLKPGETKGGKPMVFFSLATFKKMGEGKDDKAQFHSCVAYGNLADIIIKHVEEKRSLFVEGEVDYYKDKEEVQRTQIILQRFEFID